MIRRHARTMWTATTPGKSWCLVRGKEFGANSTSPAAGSSWSAAVRLATEFLSIVLVVHVTRPPRPPSTWRVFWSLQETKVKMFGDVNGAGGSGKLFAFVWSAARRLILLVLFLARSIH